MLCLFCFSKGQNPKLGFIFLSKHGFVNSLSDLTPNTENHRESICIVSAFVN